MEARFEFDTAEQIDLGVALPSVGKRRENDSGRRTRQPSRALSPRAGHSVDSG